MIPEDFFRAGEDRPEGADILATDAGLIDGYRVVYLRHATGWNAYSPDIAVFAGGETRADAETTMRAAIAFHLGRSAQDRVAS
ncbi:MAG TPA: hypothetical protein VN837_18385 [Chloroflexota bacterium]|nr:hypothetical protein [Chloroflexota bacterium]